MIRLKDLRDEIGGGAEAEKGLEMLRDAVVEQWEQETGLLWSLRSDYVEVISNLGAGHSTCVWLSLRPVSAVTKVEQRDWYNGRNAYIELDEDLYAVDGHVIEKVDGVPWMGTVKVTYSGGYDEDTCPADVRLACLKQAAFLAVRTGSTNLMLAGHSSRAGSSSNFLPPDLHPLFKETAIKRGRKA